MVMRRRQFSTKARRYILERDNYTCAYCGVPARVVDHIIPTSRGGRGTRANGVAACWRCNSKKGAKIDLLRIAKNIFVVVAGLPPEITTRNGRISQWWYAFDISPRTKHKLEDKPVRVIPPPYYAPWKPHIERDDLIELEIDFNYESAPP